MGIIKKCSFSKFYLTIKFPLAYRRKAASIIFCQKNNRWIYDYFYKFALHIVIFEIFVKSMTSCLSELKVTHSFCFAFKIPDNVTATTTYLGQKFHSNDISLEHQGVSEPNSPVLLSFLCNCDILDEF